MVRKWVAILLLFVGAFLLVTALVAKVWAPDAAQRTPLNVDTDTFLSGEADKLNPATGELEHVAVKYTSKTLADPKKSDGDYVAFVNTKCVNIDENDPPPCLEDTDDRLITNSIDTFATDRRTAMATDKTKYLAEDAVVHEGLVNKWPFNAEKKTYPYWNGTLGTTVDAKYVGTEDIDGLETYRYDVVVPETPAEVLAGTRGHLQHLREHLDRAAYRVDHQPDRWSGPQARERRHHPRHQRRLHRRDRRRQRQGRQGQPEDALADPGHRPAGRRPGGPADAGGRRRHAARFAQVVRRRGARGRLTRAVGSAQRRHEDRGPGCEGLLAPGTIRPRCGRCPRATAVRAAAAARSRASRGARPSRPACGGAPRS